jgi:hypothetical protein
MPAARSATLLKEGVPLATVHRVLRHSDPRLTTEIYGHLDAEGMPARLDRLQIAAQSPHPPSVSAEVQDSSNVISIFRPNGAPVVRGLGRAGIGQRVTS